jgi:hypothetical protein
MRAIFLLFALPALAQTTRPAEWLENDYFALQRLHDAGGELAYTRLLLEACRNELHATQEAYSERMLELTEAKLAAREAMEQLAAVGLDTQPDADANADGCVDGKDLAIFEACFSGPCVPASWRCLRLVDLDGDGDVDQDDFGMMQRELE